MLTSGTHEKCQHCNAWVKLGKLGAFAANMRSLRAGVVLLCSDCKPLWREASAWLVRVSN